MAGGTEFTEFAVYPNYASASASLATQPGLYDKLATAKAELGVANPTLRYLIVESVWTFNDDKSTLLVYLSDNYGSAYLAANLAVPS